MKAFHWYRMRWTFNRATQNDPGITKHCFDATITVCEGLLTWTIAAPVVGTKANFVTDTQVDVTEINFHLWPWLIPLTHPVRELHFV